MAIFTRKSTHYSIHAKGFTLIELLVTVSIIGVLSAVGLASYVLVNKNARDTKRISDLRLIQSALEQYRADNFYYPLPGSGSGCTGTEGSLIFGCPLKNSSATKTYLNKVPSDTNSSTDYLYVALDNNFSSCSSNCIRYCLYADLENIGSQQKPSQCVDSNGRNFAVIPP